MSNPLNLLNQRFGKGVVIAFAGHRSKGLSSKRQVRLWKLLCDCGKEYVTYTELLRNGDCSSCGCQKIGFHRNSTTTTTLSRYLKHLKYDAKKRNKQFNLNKEQLENLLIKQNNKCALSGIPISFNDSSASLDRKNNDLDYFIENVQWVHRKVNYMKNTLEEKDFIRLCSLVSSYSDQNSPLYIHQSPVFAECKEL